MPTCRTRRSFFPTWLRAWQEGYDVVLMRRASRAQESWLKKVTARAFYRAIGSIGTVDIPENVGDFRLLSRRAVEALARFPERSRFMKGLFAWIGFPRKEIVYDRDGRYAGKTKWNYWRLWNFALEGITSFSVVPLKIASYVGFVDRPRCVRLWRRSIGKTLLFGDPVAGYPDARVLVLFLGGLQLMALGIIGEYLARMFIEVKQRPLYLVPGTCHPHGRFRERARAPRAPGKRKWQSRSLRANAAASCGCRRPRDCAPRDARTVSADGLDGIPIRRNRAQDGGDGRLAHAAVRLRRAFLGQAAAVDVALRGIDEGAWHQ